MVIPKSRKKAVRVVIAPEDKPAGCQWIDRSDPSREEYKCGASCAKGRVYCRKHTRDAYLVHSKGNKLRKLRDEEIDRA